MKIRLADYVADFLVAQNITDVFSVIGGGAMHLNDAFGHHPSLHVTYNHHEQASAMAAEGYARIKNAPAAVCVTTGPGGTNALTGVVGAYTDSIPMIVISGQVRYNTTHRYAERFTNGRPLRVVGDQEFDITKAVSSMTKYAVMIEDPQTIRYHLEKAYHEATTGRPGPVWLDIPVDFQGMTIETDTLTGYEEKTVLPAVSDGEIEQVLSLLREARRPVFFAGNGIRLSGGYALFRQVLEELSIPVVTYWDSIDLIESEHPLYTGRAGNMGDRAGNFAVQDADVLLAVGNRLPIRVTGFHFAAWARQAHVVMVDIDEAELYKPAIHVETKIHSDAKIFLEKMLAALKKNPMTDHTAWVEKCRALREKYPVLLPRMREENDGFANAYYAFDCISRFLPEKTVTVTSNGTPCVAGHQTWYIKNGSRFLNNNGMASMGYGLPSAIGASIATGGKNVVCLEGDGSLMMNLQELMSVVTNRLPIKLFIINNEGYHSLRQTQNNLFGDHTHVGIGPESGDLGFPEYRKVLEAFGWPYFSVRDNKELPAVLEKMFANDSFAACEIFVSKKQIFEPKSATKKLPSGKLFSPPLEDLAPFLERDELKQIMDIPLCDEE